MDAHASSLDVGECLATKEPTWAVTTKIPLTEADGAMIRTPLTKKHCRGSVRAEPAIKKPYKRYNHIMLHLMITKPKRKSS